jgi:hypothetical protein
MDINLTIWRFLNMKKILLSMIFACFISNAALASSDEVIINGLKFSSEKIAELIQMTLLFNEGDSDACCSFVCLPEPVQGVLLQMTGLVQAAPKMDVSILKQSKYSPGWRAAQQIAVGVAMGFMKGLGAEVLKQFINI